MPASPDSPQTVVLKKDKLNTLTEEDDDAEEKRGHVTAWENKPTSPKGMYCVGIILLLSSEV